MLLVGENSYTTLLVGTVSSTKHPIPYFLCFTPHWYGSLSNTFTTSTYSTSPTSQTNLFPAGAPCRLSLFFLPHLNSPLISLISFQLLPLWVKFILSIFHVFPFYVPFPNVQGIYSTIVSFCKDINPFSQNSILMHNGINSIYLVQFM